MPDDTQDLNSTISSMSTKSDSFTEESDETDATQEIDTHRREQLLEQTRVNQAAGALVQLSNESRNANQGNTEKEDDEARAMDGNEVELDVEDEDTQTEDDKTEESDDSSEEDSEMRKESRK
jgi:hypothetical protein